MAVLELKNVQYTYKTQYQENNVLKGINHSFGEGAVHAIMGKSGSGKTTLLSLMAGLDLPTAGEVLCEGESTAKMNLEQYRRERVAVIYQSFRLFPLLTAAENVMYPMELRGVRPAEAKKKAAELLEKVGLSEAMMDRFPTMLSGGEQQRVAIARALGMDTRVLLADEPTGNLDDANGEQVMDILIRLAHETGRCVIVVTHDQELASRADTVVYMHDGVLYEEKP
ncbi:MAG: ABC transporter ATP-binding protein [Oscillospiraceae bacterium]|nr:ABC transporter ATP-binding protein [Oscillospiraceae bacterium]